MLANEIRKGRSSAYVVPSAEGRRHRLGERPAPPEVLEAAGATTMILGSLIAIVVSLIAIGVILWLT